MVYISQSNSRDHDIQAAARLVHSDGRETAVPRPTPRHVPRAGSHRRRAPAQLTRASDANESRLGLRPPPQLGPARHLAAATATGARIRAAPLWIRRPRRVKSRRHGRM